MKGKISVIVPVYKAEPYLDRCVESIVNQTYKNLEIILVDDGSPDNSPNICDDWAKKDERIKVIHKKNGGVSSARNAGIKEATGEFVQFVDSDDYIDLSFCEQLVTPFEGDVDLVVSGFTITNDEKKTTITKREFEDVSNIMGDIEAFLNFLIDGYIDMPVNKLFRRNLITFQFRENLPLGEDRIFVLDYLMNSKQRILVIESSGYFYIFNNQSACHKQRKNIFDILLESHDYLRLFLEKKFGTYKNNKFYKLMFGFVENSICRCIDEEKSQTYKKIKNNKLIKEILKNYKPKGIKEKIKYILIKFRMYGLLRLIITRKSKT